MATVESIQLRKSPRVGWLCTSTFSTIRFIGTEFGMYVLSTLVLLGYQDAGPFLILASLYSTDYISVPIPVTASPTHSLRS